MVTWEQQITFSIRSNSHKVRGDCAGLRHSMVTGVSMQNKRPHRKGQRVFNSFSGFFSECSLEWGKACEDLLWNQCTPTPSSCWDKWCCRTGNTQRERRSIPDTSAIWSGWKMVGCFHGMLLPFAQRSRPLVGRRFGESFSGPIIPYGSMMVEHYPVSAKVQSRLRQFGKEKVLPGILICCVLYEGMHLEKRHYGCRRWRAGKFGRVGSPCWET